MLDGHAPITGAAFLVTENEQEELPHELVAVHVTVVVPIANEEPEAGVQLTVGDGDPVAVGVV